MLFPIPNSDINLRFFQRVETKDDQYDIFDIGVEHADGGIDSLVVGGSFSSLKKAVAKADEGATLNRKLQVAEAQCISKDMVAELANEPAIQGVVKHPVVNYDGAEQDIEGL